MAIASKWPDFYHSLDVYLPFKMIKEQRGIATSNISSTNLVYNAV